MIFVYKMNDFAGASQMMIERIILMLRSAYLNPSRIFNSLVNCPRKSLTDVGLPAPKYIPIMWTDFVRYENWPKAMRG